jgi:hypothetical protein
MNSKYLEKLIQEEYQKIIQEQDDTKKPDKELTPNQAGGLNSKTCIDQWQKDDREYFRKYFAYTQQYDFLDVPLWKYGYCVFRIDLANTFTTVFNTAAQEIAGERGTFSSGNSFYFYGNGTCSALGVIVGESNAKELKLSWNRSDNPKKGLEIYSDRQYIGNIVSTGGRNLMYIPKEEQKQIEYADDWLQSVADWLGLIPFYGDILDVANGIRYMQKGRNFEAGLSFLAVIPVVGSVFKLGIKGSMKLFTVNMKIANSTVKRIFMGNKAAVADLWKIFQDDGALKKMADELGMSEKAFLKQLNVHIDTAKEVAEKGYKKATDLNYPEHVQDLAQSLVKFFDESKLTIAQLERIAVKQGQKIGTKTFRRYTKIANAFKDAASQSKTTSAAYQFTKKTLITVFKISGAITVAPYIIRRAFKFNRKSFDELAAGYRLFLRKKILEMSLQGTEALMAPIIRAMPYDQLVKAGKDGVKAMSTDMRATAAKVLKDRGFNKEQITNVLASNDQIMKVLADPIYANEPIMRGFIKKHGEKILDAAEQGNNLAYNFFFNNKAWQAEKIFERGSTFKQLVQDGNVKKALSTLLGEYWKLKNIALNSKNIDGFYNVFMGVLDQIGLRPQGTVNPDSFILPLIFAGIDVKEGRSFGTTKQQMKIDLLAPGSTLIHGSEKVQNFIEYARSLANKSGTTNNSIIKLLFNVLDFIPVLAPTGFVGPKIENIYLEAAPYNDPKRNKAWTIATWEKIPDEHKPLFQKDYDELLGIWDAQIEQENQKLQNLEVPPSQDNTQNPVQLPNQ